MVITGTAGSSRQALFDAVLRHHPARRRATTRKGWCSIPDPQESSPRKTWFVTSGPIRLDGKQDSPLQQETRLRCVETIVPKVRLLVGLVRCTLDRSVADEKSAGVFIANPRELHRLFKTAQNTVQDALPIPELKTAVAQVFGSLITFWQVNGWWGDFLANKPTKDGSDIRWLDFEAISFRVPRKIDEIDEVLDYLEAAIAEMPRTRGEGNETTKKTFTVGQVCDLADVCAETLNKYAKKAGVKTPARGKRNHRYTLDEVRKMLSFMASKVSSAKMQSKCQTSLANLKETQE